MLKRATPAYYANRNKIQKFNSYCGDPYDWFDTEYFRNEGLYPLTFDFFIATKNPTIGEKLSNMELCKNIFEKRLIYDNSNYLSKSEEEIFEAIVKCDTRPYVNMVYRFAKKHKLNLSYLIIPDTTHENWEQIDKNNEKQIIVFSISNFLDKTSPVITYLTVGELVSYIQSMKNNSFKVTKPFIYPPTTLEYYLAKEKNECWALDADIVLIDKLLNIKYIIEIKKETDSSKIDICDENVNIYKDKDFKKYNALCCLNKYFGSFLYILYYYADETKTNINNAKTAKHIKNRLIKIAEIDKLTDIHNQFDIIKEKTFSLPNHNYPTDLKSFTENFIKFSELVTPKCPKCNQKLVLKTNKQTQQLFWACPNFCPNSCQTFKAWKEDEKSDDENNT